jgi:hypothetical protein
MTFSKEDLIKLTENTTGVDAAIPEHWLQEVEKLGFDRHDIIYSYGYSYKGNSFGKPLNLPLEFIKLLEQTEITIKDINGKKLGIGREYTLAEFIKSFLTNTDKWEIRLKC